MFLKTPGIRSFRATLLMCLILVLVIGKAGAGEVTVVGSSTLEPFLKRWAALLKSKPSAPEVAISSPGTSVAPKALTHNKADIGAMNREMTNDEVETFIRVNGHYPTAIVVAIEAIALYTHPDNPLQGLDIAQIEGMYASDRGCSYQPHIATWGQLGLDGDWKTQAIVLLGHDKKSAIRDYLNTTLLCRDTFKTGVAELNPNDLLNSIAQNKFAIGYGSYQPGSKLKIMPIKKGAGGFVPLTPENIYNRTYRLQHYLYVYVNKPKDKSINPAVLEFLKVGLSAQGQQAVKDAGYVPLSDELIQRQLAKLK